MRKAFFLNFPTHGCINPLLATASELVDRGEKIIYYCTEEFRDKIEQTGAEFCPYKGLINKFKIDKLDLFKALKLNIEMAVDKMDHNLDAIRKENPDYLEALSSKNAEMLLWSDRQSPTNIQKLIVFNNNWNKFAVILVKLRLEVISVMVRTNVRESIS